MKYKISRSRMFKTALKKLSKRDQDLTEAVIDRLAAGETLEPRYCDHALSGAWRGFRDCHVRPDLVLLYKLDGQHLIITCMNIKRHSGVFKK